MSDNITKFPVSRQPVQPIQPGQSIQFQITDSNSTPILCDNCKGEFFQQAIKLAKVSALVSPNGQELLAQIPVLICLECRAVYGAEGKIG